MVTIFATQLCWSLATPLFSGPDEPTQVIKAASVAHGELSITQAHRYPSPYTIVRVPRIYTESSNYPLCFMFQPTQSAKCAGSFPPKIPITTTRTANNRSSHPPSQMVGALTYVGRYPPLYYLLVGLPGLLSSTSFSVYLMRTLSDLVSSVLIGVSLCLALDISQSKLRASERDLSIRPLFTIGVLFAIVPAFQFASSVVNPNGLEAAAALGLWTSIACLKFSRTEIQSKRSVYFCAISACIEGSMRGLSPFWVACSLLVGVLYLGKTRSLEIWSWRYTKVIGAISLIVCLADSAWIFLANTLEIAGTSCTQNCPSLYRNAARAFGNTWQYVHQLIGTFGWINLITNNPARNTSIFGWEFWIYLGVIFTLLTVSVYSWMRTKSQGHVTGALLGRSQLSIDAQVVAIVGLLCLVVFLPVVIQASQANRFGFIWQGRYVMPLATGLPVLGLAIAKDGTLTRNLGKIAGILWGILGCISLYATLHRYMVGTSGSLFIFSNNGWSPPISAAIICALYLICTVVIVRAIAKPMQLR